MKVAIKAYHPAEGEVRDMAPKSLLEFSEWVIRGVRYGYVAQDLGHGAVRFTSNKPEQTVVFTAKLVNE